jgi:hypothetical protein
MRVAVTILPGAAATAWSTYSPVADLSGPRHNIDSAVNMYLWYSTFMSTTSAPSTGVNSRDVLLPYTLVLLAVVSALQIVIAATGGEIGILAGALTALMAIGVAAWFWRSYAKLRRIRFGVVVAHTITFVAVTTSFAIGALASTIALVSQDQSGLAAERLLSTPWFGATLVMSAIWGIGLFAHLVGTVVGRGWED